METPMDKAINPSHPSGISSRNLSTSYQYEYPNRTEAPIITRSAASTELEDDESSTSSTASLYSIKNVAIANHDPFDDTATLSPAEQNAIRQSQKSNISSTLPSSFSIQATPPPSLPPNLPRESLLIPSTEVTVLPNGIRVASQETYGQVTTFGILSDCGSRLETKQQTGVNHLMELLAFSGTPSLNSTEFQTTLDSLGGVSFASSSREQFLYCIDVLRPNVDESMKLLRDVILEPRLDADLVEEMKRVVEFQWMDMVPEVVLGEGLQIAGYGPKKGKDSENANANVIQQLGKSHFCPLESLQNLDSSVVQSFRNEHLLNPESMVVAAAGMRHENLVKLAEEHFGHLEIQTNTNQTIIPSEYTGGCHRQILPTPDGFTRVALAFPTGGWHSSDLVPACVLQTLLGGGSSFSAGGPGKGMYSRLYRQVLNRYYWAESCESFTSFHEESGLFGITGSAVGHKAGDVTRVLAENIMRLAIDEVEDEELDRAKNMLKNNVLTQLESRLVLFEDIGRQILTYGKREGTEEMCAKIDAVDKKGLRDLMRRRPDSSV
jgi:processing peptidase subunit alpha